MRDWLQPRGWAHGRSRQLRSVATQLTSPRVASLRLRILPACSSRSDLRVQSRNPIFGRSCSTPAAAHTTGELARAFLAQLAGGRLAIGHTLSCRMRGRGFLLGSNSALAAGLRCEMRQSPRGRLSFVRILREQNGEKRATPSVVQSRACDFYSEVVFCLRSHLAFSFHPSSIHSLRSVLSMT